MLLIIFCLRINRFATILRLSFPAEQLFRGVFQEKVVNFGHANFDLS